MTHRLGLVRGLHDHVGLSVTTWDKVATAEGEMFLTSKHEVKRFSNPCPGPDARVAESRGRTSKNRANRTQ
jgi:hypothetical protein